MEPQTHTSNRPKLGCSAESCYGYARESNTTQPAAEPKDKTQLFYARAPISATVQDVRDLFAGFGEATLLFERSLPFDLQCDGMMCELLYLGKRAHGREHSHRCFSPEPCIC